MSTEELLNTFVEIRLVNDNFLVVKETLSRIGVGVEKTKKLYPSCVLLHKQGKYYILHFKEAFKLDRKSSDFSESDLARRNTIANLLAQWGLVEIVNPEIIQEPKIPGSQLKIVAFKDKKNWEIVPKYSVGK